jgi:trimeric autotransporter adhesin
MPLQSQLNVDIVNPSTNTTLTVNQVEISQPIVGTGGPGPFRNTIIGTGAGASLTTGPLSSSGTMNVVLGTDAFRLQTFGRQNTIIGEKAMELTSNPVDACVAVGNMALGLGAMVTGTYGQTAIGTGALMSVVSGMAGDPAYPLLTFTQNTALGIGAGQNLLSGGNNIFIGAGSGGTLTSGIGNTVIGSEFNATSVTATGNYNTFVGASKPRDFAGGNNNTYIGSQNWTVLLTPLSETGNNNILVGSNVTKATVSASNSITLGNSSNSVLRCAVTSITSLSDSRDKEEVAELAVGLEFVKELNPVSFVWNDRDESGKHGVKDFGFIAQDLKSTQEKYEMAETLGLVYEENPEKLEASYGKLIPILVKAIQELTAKVEQLENK